MQRRQLLKAGAAALAMPAIARAQAATTLKFVPYADLALSAPDDKTIRFRLKRRFDLLPAALAHPTNTMAAIMPERLTTTPPGHRAA